MSADRPSHPQADAPETKQWPTHCTHGKSIEDETCEDCQKADLNYRPAVPLGTPQTQDGECAKCWLPRGHQGECDPETVPRCGASPYLPQTNIFNRPSPNWPKNYKGWREMRDGREALVRDVIDKARCIRHWHDTGRNGEGMIVSAEAVRDLWGSLARLDESLSAGRIEYLMQDSVDGLFHLAVSPPKDEAKCEKCGKTIGGHFGMRCESGSDESVWTHLAVSGPPKETE